MAESVRYFLFVFFLSFGPLQYPGAVGLSRELALVGVVRDARRSVRRVSRRVYVERV